MGWTYHGVNVQVPRTADIPPQFWFGRPLSEYVQRVLDMIEPWKNGDDPIETKRLDNVQLLPLVVPLGGKKPWWGIHGGHAANRVQASPFVEVDVTRLSRTDLFTVELVQTPQRPRLVRAYPGDYIPPLPWMISAEDAPGGVASCERFWREHGYVYRRSTMLSRRPCPDWYRK